ncbi:MAG: NAD(P)-dependent oxidoreductase [Planctomycetes bacterium]|nr:NAD(P)-dependent oxidoreductase [Planctomycetota bacterium]
MAVPADPSGRERAVLVTGVPGNIGSYFAEHAPPRFRLRLMAQREDERTRALSSRGEIVVGDLADLTRLTAHCRGIDTIVHLAADPSPDATWDELLEPNIVGAYHLFAAAKAAGCRRVVFASSVHAVLGYPDDHQVRTDDAVNPANLYGVTKCFGEALGRYYAEQQGLSVIAIRIGAFQPLAALHQDWFRGFAHGFVSQRDLIDLICRCIDDDGCRFAIVHGLSDNRFKCLDLTDTRDRFGYHPQDDAFRELESDRPPA